MVRIKKVYFTTQFNETLTWLFDGKEISGGLASRLAVILAGFSVWACFARV